MKKKSASETGLVNPRVFAAFLLCLAAVSMAMLSFASTPSSGTLTDTSGPLTYTAGPFFQPNAFGNSIAGECDPDPSDPFVPCDINQLHVVLPAGYVQDNPNQHLFVRIDWSTPAARFDLYLWDARNWTGGSFPNGTPIASSTQTGTNFQQVEVTPDAAANGVVVQVRTTLPAGQSFTGTISLGPASTGHGTVQPPGNASGIAPRFQEYIPTDANGAPSSSLGLFAGEPTIGVDTKVNADKGGDLFYQALYEILRIRFDDTTSPAKATWEFKDPPTGASNKASTDPIFLADPATGRLWATQLAGGDSLTDISNDDGDSWTIRAVPDSTGGLTSKGDPSVGIDPDGTIYLAYQNLNNNHLFVAVSHDKGATFVPSVDVGALAGINYSVFPAATAGGSGRA